MSALGFIKDIEYLVSFDKFEDSNSQRRLFLEFFNTQVDKKIRFTKNEICTLSNMPLKDIFVAKICVMLGIVSIPYVTHQKHIIKNLKFDITLNKFIPNINIPKACFSLKIYNKNKTDLQSAIKLINLIDSTNFDFRLDARDAFRQYILNKLLKDQKTRYINNTHNSISIIPTQEEPLMIYPFWEMVGKSNQLIDEHIQKAVECIKQSDFKQVYLVYPKNENFEKHIEIKIREFEDNISCRGYVVKIIPYSLRSILR
ncbi:hypothetical protein [Arcobacter sp. FWKO B]|uniref:hypothetical protein n=1 Tax=Arcobacter sp. FWKO B TaxID=2593672 RepID=UPI0018A3821D|nr:hypothetical protein [Arcobacter sp. FWKO B]QOG12769.1 hypothetical protein FWKOB_08715 [Arcobacter sp. FWKO B]